MLTISIQREIKSRQNEPTDRFNFDAEPMDVYILIEYGHYICTPRVCTFVYSKSEFQMCILKLSPMNTFA